MKILRNIIFIGSTLLVMLYLCDLVFSEEINFELGDATPGSLLVFTPPEVPELEFTAEGKVILNDKLITELDYPEIRDLIKQIAGSMREDIMTSFYARQTDYLLEELEKCRDK